MDDGDYELDKPAKVIAATDTSTTPRVLGELRPPRKTHSQRRVKMQHAHTV